MGVLTGQLVFNLIPVVAALFFLLLAIPKAKRKREEQEQREQSVREQYVREGGAQIDREKVRAVSAELERRVFRKKLGSIWTAVQLLGGLAFLMYAYQNQLEILTKVAGAAALSAPLAAVLIPLGSKVKNFYTELLPEVLADAYAEFSPAPMKPPKAGFFAAPVPYGMRPYCSYGTLGYGRGGFTAEGFYYVSLKYCRNQNERSKQRIFSRSGWYEMDQGLVVRIRTGRSRGGGILIREAQERGPSGWLVRGSAKLADQSAGRDAVALEDPVFERYFQVRAEDRGESREFLTPVQMRRLVRLRELAGRYQAYYKEDRITVSFRDFRMCDTEGVYEDGIPKHLKAETVEASAAQLKAILDHIELLWEEEA